MKFTIGLPTTKSKYLKESLDSIESQIFKDYEVIIRNNAKTTELKAEIKEICKDWIGRENVVYEESQEQLSMPANFNKILEKAKGEYFTVLSDDDIMHPEFLKEFDQLISKYSKTNAFHCRMEIIDENGNFLNINELCPEWESRLDFIYHKLTGKRETMLSDFIVSTAKFKEIGGFPIESTGWGIDELSWCRLAENGIAFTPKVLLSYRKFLGNYTNTSKNLVSRFNNINFLHLETQKLINESYKTEECVYPYNFLIDLNNKKKQKLKDDVLIRFAKSNYLLSTLFFYLKNKSQISFKGLVKSFGSKLEPKSK